MTRKQIHLYCVVSMFLLVFSGCSKKEDTPVPVEESTHAESTLDVKAPPSQDSPEPEAAKAQNISFNEVLVLWESGQQEQAAKLFLDIDWSWTDVLAADSIFGMSEAEFIKLPEDQRMQVQQEAMKEAKAVKEMIKFVTEQAKQANADIEQYRQVLLACGQRLSADDQMMIIKMVGKAVAGYVDKELGAGD